MTLMCRRAIGCLLIAVGVLVAAFSQQIVFPGLERVLGIETVVGRDNVVYLPEGGYVFTNPGTMVGWVAAVAAVGILIGLAGGFMLFRAWPPGRE